MSDADEERNRALARLHGVTRELIQCSTPDRVAELATNAARDIMGMRISGVFLVDDDCRLVPAAATSESKELFGAIPTFERGGGMVGRTFETGEPIICSDVSNNWAAYNPDTPIRSELVFPLGDHGVFVAGSTEPDAFREDDVTLARVLAANTQVTLDRIRGERELREQKRQIEALYGIATEFETCRTEAATYRLTVEAAEDLLGFTRCAVDRVEGETLREAATSSRMPPLDGCEGEPVPEFVRERPDRTGETLLVDDVGGSEEFGSVETDYRSVLSAPIGEFGVFRAVSERRGAFGETDRRLVELLLTYVAEALRRVRREQRVRDLHTATRELFRAETDTEVADIVVETAREMLNLPLTSVQLYDEEDDALHPRAFTDAVDDLLDGVPSIESGDGLIWRAFSTGEVEVHDDVRDDPDVMNAGTEVRSQAILPLGSYGVLICNSTEVANFDANDVTLARVLAENAHAALNRTERERVLQARNREIERQNEHLEQFAGVVSHDLRNPVNVAAGHLELVREECRSDHLEPVARALVRMEELIDDVLTLARHGQPIGEPGPVPLRGAVTEAWSTAGAESAALVVADDLPTVRADETRLRELLENVFRNAIDHAGPDVTVAVGRLPRGFSVEDDGPGIPEDRREKVLEWGHSTDRDGTGLGLGIVTQIAEAHGWSVAVTGGSNGGARFEVTGVESA